MLLPPVGTGNSPFILEHFRSFFQLDLIHPKFVSPFPGKLCQPIFPGMKCQSCRCKILQNHRLAFLMIDFRPLLNDVGFPETLIAQVCIKLIIRIFQRHSGQPDSRRNLFRLHPLKLQHRAHVPVGMQHMQSRFPPIRIFTITIDRRVCLIFRSSSAEYLFQSSAFSEILLEEISFFIHPEH